MSSLAKGYLDTRTVVQASRSAGMPVGDYVEKYLSREACPFSLEGGPGYARRMIERLLSRIDLRLDAHCLEIGPGTGRYYAELFLRRPALTYEYYEPSADWAAWLADEYAERGPIRRESDGCSLKETSSDSVDLCMAYGVFVYLDTMITLNYLKETARCLRQGGHLFFDFFDTDRADILAVVGRTMTRCNYLIPISKGFLLRYLNELGLTLVGTFDPLDSDETSTYLLLRMA